jgi:excisionase family DNA binding protein
MRPKRKMRAKRCAIAKVGKHVVTFADDGIATGIGNLGLEELKGLKSLGARGPPSGDDEVLDPLLTVNEAAGLLRCSPHTLNKWRITGNGPRFVRVGSRVRYRRSDLAAFITTSTRISTSDAGNAARAMSGHEL